VTGTSLYNRQSRHHVRQGFTLIELLVAVSILSIGIVGVLRSFLNAVSVLDSVNNRLSAIQILETKLNEVSALTLMGENDLLEERKDEVNFQGRKASFQLTTTPWNNDTEDLKKILMSITWQEGPSIKDETIIFVLPANT
jgi:type II secretion system protein I